MHADINSVPKDFDAQEFMEKWQQTASIQLHNAAVVSDPSGNLVGDNIGIWSQITTGSTLSYPFKSALEEKVEELEKNLELVKLDSKLLRLKILSMEGKFTQEEVTNIRKMLMSEDEASKTLANSIIENA